MNFGEVIKTRRKALGLSAEDLAERTQISPATIYRYENGSTKSPKLSMLHKIGDVLSIDMLQHMEWEDLERIVWDDLPDKGAVELPQKPLEDNEFEQLNRAIVGFEINNDESRLLYKYRLLDAHGKDIVDTIIDKEYLRSLPSNENKLP